MHSTVLVTGGSRGIGAALVRLFAKNNYNVVFCYKSKRQQAEKLAADLCKQGFNVSGFMADVSKQRDVEHLFENVKELFGSVDILINNAGVSSQRLFCDINEREWDEMFDVHVKGTYFCCRKFLPEMLSRKKGCIINIASIWGLTGASCESHYAAAKGAIIALTKSLAKEEGPSGIRVNCIAPGVIRTEMMAGFAQEDIARLADDTPLGHIGVPEDVAEAALFLASDKAKFITGQVLGVDGGFAV